MAYQALQAGEPCTIVIKLGTSSVINEKDHSTKYPLLRSVASTVAKLRQAGFTVVLVSSGAVGFGLQKLGLTTPCSGQKPALAAIGQGEMMSVWSEIFGKRGVPVAQLLFAHSDVSSPERCYTAEQTFQQLFDAGVVPIVNENDTLPSKIRIGDNDTLGAMIADIVGARYLFLLTDVDALYDSNPKHNMHACRINQVSCMHALRASLDCADLGAGTPNGTGGMATKLRAAEIGMAAGVRTVIMSSSRPATILDVLEYHHRERSDSVASDSSEESVICSAPCDELDSIRPPHTLFCPMDPSMTERLSHFRFGTPDNELNAQLGR